MFLKILLQGLKMIISRKNKAKLIALGLSISPLVAFAEGEVDSNQAMYDAVTMGLTGVVAFVAALALIVIGIKLAEKGISIATRNIKKG
jgi:uncharacterized protein YqgC (DUF456 family)